MHLQILFICDWFVRLGSLADQNEFPTILYWVQLFLLGGS